MSLQEIDDVFSLQKGDVITFWTIIDGKKVKNTHRIVEITELDGSTSFVTRGDNNQLDDTVPVLPSDIIGKWTEFKISGFGKVMSFLRTKTGFFVCIVIPMAVFFLVELYKFIVTLIELKSLHSAKKMRKRSKNVLLKSILLSRRKSRVKATLKHTMYLKTKRNVSHPFYGLAS